MLALLLQLAGCREDSTGLHGRNLRECDTQTASTVTQHGVILSQALNAALDSSHIYPHLLSHNLLASQIVRHELMERRVEQTDINRTTIHGLQNTLEVGLLIRQQLV